MKTIPLKTLLESITRLPWKMHGTGSIVPSDYNSDGAYLYCRETSRLDMNYIIHCCNHFPELVVVAREFQTCVQRDWHVPQELCDRMAKILASAETVQIEE